jgi:hypothetical protein
MGRGWLRRQLEIETHGLIDKGRKDPWAQWGPNGPETPEAIATRQRTSVLVGPIIAARPPPAVSRSANGAGLS